MAAAGGIYIAIRGDYSQFDADMNRVRQTAKSYADGIAADLNNAVNPSQLTRGLSRITEALAQAKRSIETQAPRVQWLDAIAKEANVSKKQLESLSNQWLQTQRTMTQDRAFAQLQQMTGASTAQLAQLRRELGNVSGALKAAMSGMSIRTQSAIVEDMRNVVASYREVRNNATATASDVKRAGDTMRESLKQLSAEARGMKAPNLTPFHSALQTLTQNAGLSTTALNRLKTEAASFSSRNELKAAFQQIQQATGASTLQMARLQASLGDVRGAFGTVAAGANAAKIAILAVSASVALAGKAILDAALQADRLDKAYTTITGSAAGAQQELSYLYDMSNRLGQQFQITAEAAKGFFAAGAGTPVEKEMKKIFEAAMETASALALTSDQSKRMLLALQQMVSKGKISAEELRQQLGEVLPGAFQIFADAAGVSAAELDKMLKDGKVGLDVLIKAADIMHEKFGEAAIEAAQGMQGAINHLSTEWGLFKASLVDSSAATDAINALRSAIEGMQAAVETVKKYGDELKAVFVAIASSGAFLVLTKSIPVLGFVAAGVFRLTGSLVALKTTFSGITALIVTNPWFAFAAAMGTVAGTVYYYTQKTDAAKQAQEELDSAKKLSIEINDALASSQERTNREIKTYTEVSREQLAALEESISHLRERLTTAADFGKMTDAGASPWMSYLVDDSVFDSLNQFEQRLVALRTEAAKTGDFKLLEQGLKELELEAKAAGADTDNFKKIIEETRAVAALGIKLGISLEGYQETVNKLEWLKRFQETYGTTEGMPTTFYDWKEKRDIKFAKEKAKILEDVQKDFNRSVLGRTEELNKKLKVYREQLNDPQKYNLSKEEIRKLNVAIGETEKAIKDLGKTAGGNRGLEQAKRNAENYRAELEKTKASVEAYHQQLALDPADAVAAKQIQIQKAYDDSRTALDKYIQSLSRQKGINSAQVAEIKALKQEEIELKKNLALRQAEESQRQKNLELARDQLDFYQDLEDLTGSYGLSLELQNRLLAEQEQIFREIYKLPGEYIRQWRTMKDLMNSRDWADGAVLGIQSYLKEANNMASKMESTFGELFSGLNSAGRNLWDDFFENGKMNLDSFKDVFRNFLAQLAHMAITQPIVVSLGTSLQNSLWGASSGSVVAGQANPFGNNTGLLSNMLPDSWKSGISHLTSWTLPGIAATVPYAGTAGTVMSATGGAANVAGLHAAEAAATGGNAGGGMLATNVAGTTSGMGLGTALGYGAAGSLGYTMLGGALGLPQSKYSGLTAGLGGALGAWGGTAAGTAMGVAAGSTLGSVVPIVGTALGALAGGALGSLFGSGNKTHPGTGMRVHDAPLYSPGTDYRQLYVNEANYWRSSYKDSSPYFDTMGQVTQNIVSSMAGLANILPNADNLKAAMSNQTWTAGRKMEGSKGTWDFQAHDEEQLQQVIADATADVQRAVWDAMVNALKESHMEDFGLKSALDESDFSLSGLFDFASLATSIQAQVQNLGEEASKYFYEAIGSIDLSPIQNGIFGNIDFSAGAGIEKFTAQIQTLSSVMGEVSSLQNPMGDVEKAARDSMDQLADWKASLSATGIDVARLMNLEQTRDSLLQQLQDAEAQCQNGTGELDGSLQSLRDRYAAVAQQAEDYGELIHHQEYLQNQLKDSFNDLWSPMGDVERQAKANIDTINDYVEAAKRLEMSEEDITAIRNKASELQKKLVGDLRELFNPLSDIEKQTKANLDVIDDYAAAGKRLGMSEMELGQIEWYRNKVANDLVQSANALTSGMGEMEKQARQNRDTLNEYKRAAEMAGASAAQLAEIESNRTKLQNQFMASVDAALNPLSEFAQLTQSITEETKDLIAAGKQLGMTQEQLAEIESKRTAYLAQMQQQYRQDFSDDLSVRTAALHGGEEASSQVQFEINQRKELEDVIKKFGKDSEEYIVLQGVQLAEKAKYQAELAQKAADAATSAYNSALNTAQSLQREAEQAEQAVIRAGEALEQAKAQAENARIALLEYYQTQVDTAKDALEAAKKAREEARLTLVQGLMQAFDAAKNQMQTALDAWVTEADRLYTQAQNAYVNALKNNLDTATSAFETAQKAYKEALGNQISEVDATVNKFKDLAESMRKLRSDLWLDADLNPNGEQGIYDTSKNQMQSLYNRALSGDADAASELQNFSKTFLETSYKTQGDFSNYLRDFYNVQEMLADVQNKNQQQATLEQKTLDTLKAQLEAMEEPTRSLKELKEDMDKAYVFMQGQQKAWEESAEAQASLQEKTTEQLFQEMEAARTAADEAHAEQMAQYERWGFEAVVPGIEGLEQTYRTSLETLLSANKDLQRAIVEGITTQSEIASLRIDTSIKNLRDTYAQTQQAANQAQASYTKALNDQIAAQAKYGTVTIQTQLQKLQDALVASQRAVNDAAEKYYKAQTAAQNAAKAAAEAQKRAAEAAAEAARKQAEAAKAQQNAQKETNKVWSDEKYYQTKVNHLNSIKYEGRTNWTVDDVKKAFAKDGLTPWTHYQLYGKKEKGVTGYATGGIPPVGVPVIVGEQGPELAVFGSQARIYTAQETQRMLFQPSQDDATDSVRFLLQTPAWGTDGDAKAENAMLREELRVMNTTMKEMRKELEGIRKNTKESASSLDRLDTDGISQRSTQKPVRRTTWAE